MMLSWIIEWVALKFLLKQKLLLQNLLKEKMLILRNSGLSKREWNELMSAFDIKDKLI